MFRSLLRRAVLGATLPALLLAPNALAGEQIPIESWSFRTPVQTLAGGTSAGKVSYSDLSVMMSLENAPRPGARFEQAAVREGYLKYELENVIISNWQVSASSPSLVRVTLQGTGKTMGAEVMARGGVNALLLDGSVR
jgi:hypothetical protein